MPAQPYFFFRPMVATDRSWAAIDWQCAAPFSTDSAYLVRCFSESNASALAGLLPLLVPIEPAAIEDTVFLDSFAAGQVIFVLPGASLKNAATVALCTNLRRRGHRFGLQIDHGDMLRKVPICAFDSLWLDAALARQEFTASDLTYTTDTGFRKIATGVASHEMFGWLTNRAFDWSDSHFLTARNPLNSKEPDLTRLKMLRLLNLVRQDGDTRAIEGVFREEPRLSYKLLGLVNSVAVGARTKISNFSQAIAILGRRQLQRWLQMLIYVDRLADGNAPNPLMQLAAMRGRQMELLSTALVPQPEIPELSDNAFMIGLFSLLEVLINLPTKDILKELPMHDAVIDALLHRGRGGVLGQLLAAMMAGEAGDFASAEATFRCLGISAAVHAKAQITALYWAERINIENDDN